MVISLSARLAPAAVALASPFQDHMVLQQHTAVPVWGTASPGQNVTIRIAGQQHEVRVAGDGKWLVRLDPMNARKDPSELVVSAGDEQVVCRDVLVGEVWLCAGQSNMGRMVSQVDNAADEIAQADHPLIRMFTIDPIATGTPAADAVGGWAVCSPKTVAPFSATAYYFARDLQKRLDTPVGLVHASWGGSPIESWIPRDVLAGDPEFGPLLDYKYTPKDPLDAATVRKLKDDYERSVARWRLKDPGNTGQQQLWPSPDADLTSWGRVVLPGTWESTTPSLQIDGAVWFRREIDLPADWAGTELRLQLGALRDCDVTYFNGVRVGAMGLEMPSSHDVPRVYHVPGKLVRAGRNVIAVRVFSGGFSGGFWWGLLRVAPRDDKPEGAFRADGLPLDGEWRYQVEFSRQRKDAPPPSKPKDVPAWTPGSLYDGMVHPVQPYAIRGCLWYQGEGNVSRAKQYRKLFPLLISSWRTAWQKDLPFVYAQLATNGPVSNKPGDSAWAELREAQERALAIPGTAMAVTLDHPDRGEIHPTNKQVVGHRLARAALATVYGVNLAWSGPQYRSMSIEGAQVRLAFKNAASGLAAARPERLEGFTLAGADRVFHPADARIDGDGVVVWCQAVSHPVAVRYAWADTPAFSLYDKAGLPTGSFRTDDWPVPGDDIVAGGSGLPLMCRDGHYR